MLKCLSLGWRVDEEVRREERQAPVTIEIGGPRDPHRLHRGSARQRTPDRAHRPRGARLGRRQRGRRVSTSAQRAQRSAVSITWGLSDSMPGGPGFSRWAARGRRRRPRRIASSPRNASACADRRRAGRRRFATDLLNLTLAGPRVNRYEKVDRDAAEWQPAQNRCWFAARVIAVRQRYSLTIDQSEADALDQVLAGLRLDGVDHVRTRRGSGGGDVLGPRSRGDRRVGRQPERPRQLRGSSSTWDRTRDTRPSRVPVHAGRRRRGV